MLHRTICIIAFTSFSLCCYGQKAAPSSKYPKKNTTRWKGEWTRNERNNGASLEISKETNGTITFHLFAFCGGNMGEIEGKAITQGNRATYINDSDDTNCKLKFTLLGDTVIKVEQYNGYCEAGFGVYYYGKYWNTNKTTAKPEHKGLESVTGVSQIDSVLNMLTAAEYDLFVNSTQLTSEDDDLDSLGAKVYSSGIRGLYTLMENIVMFDNKKEIWAAVINANIDSIYYYTNSLKYKTTLPKTIEHWRERFKQYPVVYKSVK